MDRWRLIGKLLVLCWLVAAHAPDGATRAAGPNASISVLPSPPTSVPPVVGVDQGLTARFKLVLPEPAQNDEAVDKGAKSQKYELQWGEKGDGRLDGVLLSSTDPRAEQISVTFDPKMPETIQVITVQPKGKGFQQYKTRAEIQSIQKTLGLSSVIGMDGKLTITGAAGSPVPFRITGRGRFEKSGDKKIKLTAEVQLPSMPAPAKAEGEVTSKVTDKEGLLLTSTVPGNFAFAEENPPKGIPPRLLLCADNETGRGTAVLQVVNPTKTDNNKAVAYPWVIKNVDGDKTFAEGTFDPKAGYNTLENDLLVGASYYVVLSRTLDDKADPNFSRRINFTVIGISFIRQTEDRDFPREGDDACHMVSKFVTNVSLPEKSDYQGLIKGKLDPDTFRVQLRGLPDNAKRTVELTVQRGVRTVYRAEFGTIAAPVPFQAGLRTEKYIRLVANATDDAFQGDQTPLVQLGDVVRATLKDKAAPCFVELPVGRPPDEKGINAIRTVKCHFVVFDSPDVQKALTKIGGIPSIVERMNEAWAQCSVRFVRTGNEPVVAKALENVLVVRPIANAERFGLTIDGKVVAPFAVGAAGRRGQLQVAEDIAAGINSALGEGTASVFNAEPPTSSAPSRLNFRVAKTVAFGEPPHQPGGSHEQEVYRAAHGRGTGALRCDHPGGKGQVGGAAAGDDLAQGRRRRAGLG